MQRFHFRAGRGCLPGSRVRRFVTTLVAATTVSSGVGALAVVPAHASPTNQYNSLSFTNGDTQKTFGPNGVIMIDGTLTYDPACPKSTTAGTDDFVYPASDVYIVPEGFSGGALTDVRGGNPNTIVAMASHVFIDETIGFTAPGGKLGPGTYDVVYDTCQDGEFTPTEDTVFAGAITVKMPDGDLPPVDPSITRLKDKAREEFTSWIKVHTILKAVMNAEKLGDFAECFMAPTVGCVENVLAQLYGPTTPAFNNLVMNGALNLVMNVAKNQGAIWKDPPDANFDAPTTITRPAVGERAPATGKAFADAVASLTSPLADDAATSEALLHAIERYQGAESAGDAGWAVTHAREVRDLATTLAASMSSTHAPEDLRDVVAANADAIEQAYNQDRLTARRVVDSGFTATERQNLRNDGYDANGIAALEAQFVAIGTLPTFPTGAIKAALDDVVTARSGLESALADTASGWDAVVNGLVARGGSAATAPVANAGGPYTATAGNAITLDASASHAAAGTAITAYAWDLNGDGAFDDATGATPSTTFTGDGIVGVRVTDSTGRQAVAYVHVAVTGADRAPLVSASSPAAATSVTVGQPKTFSVTATDPDGGAVTYAWKLDDAAAGTGSSFSYDPAAAAVGIHKLSVTVSGNGDATTLRSWRVAVRLVDADHDGWTASSDCNDNRADVHPGALERFGNDVDDDCDPSTPDAPPAGPTGAVWSWGNSQGVGTGTFTDQTSPVEVTSLGQARQIESAHASGYAVMPDGSVRSWGLNNHGNIGNGSMNTARTPVTVSGIGGTGTLAGVTQVSASEGTVLARRADGTVAAWGDNVNSEVGDGSAVNNRVVPAVVIDDTGNPLSGVAAVENGDANSFALMNDGTIRNWGVQMCSGAKYNQRSGVAVANPLFGNGIVQFEASNSTGLARKADGSVWACGLSYLLDRGTSAGLLPDLATPKQMLHFGPNSGVIDIAAGSSTAAALKEDGTVLVWGRNLNNGLDVIGAAPGAEVLTPTPVVLPAGAPVVDIAMDESNHLFAVRADGSMLVFGDNVFGGAGIGSAATAVPGIGQPQIVGHVVAASSSNWNGLALVRPVDDPGWVRPEQYVHATVADAPIGEGTGGAFKVTLSAPAPDDLTVTWAMDGGATGTATIAKGATSVDIPVSVPDNAIDEPDHTVSFRIVSIDHGVRLDRDTAVGTVVDDDAPPTVNITGATVKEGDTSLTDAVVKVTLSAPSGNDVTVHYATADGTAVAPGDYTAKSGEVDIPAGATEVNIHVAVSGDTTMEPDETLHVVLTDPANATLGNADATVTLTDDEPVVVKVTSPTVNEGNSGTTPATFDVSVTPPPAGETVTVPWSIAAGTAEIPDDVHAASGTLTFDANTTTASVTADVVGDTVPEPLPTETFRLAMGNAVSSTGRAVAIGDAQPARVNEDDAVVTTPPVSADAGNDATGLEGSAIAISGSATGGSGPLTTTWTADDPRCAIAQPSALSTTVTCTDNTVVHLTLTATDGTMTAADSATVTVTNGAPVVRIDAPAAGASVAAGTTVPLQTAVSDPGSGDTVTCTVDWGDGSAPSTGCTGSHRYPASGAFTITVTATDDDGATASASTVLLVTDASSKCALVVGGGTLQGVDASVGALVVPFFGRTKIGVVAGTYTDARGRHSFGGGLTVDGFKDANGTASWSTSGILDGKRGAKIAIMVTDGGKAGPDHVKFTVTGSDGKVAFGADADVRAGGFIVR